MGWEMMVMIHLSIRWKRYYLLIKHDFCSHCDARTALLPCDVTIDIYDVFANLKEMLLF